MRAEEGVKGISAGLHKRGEMDATLHFGVARDFSVTH